MARHRLLKPIAAFICTLVTWLNLNQPACAMSYYNLRAADVTATSFTLMWQADYPAQPNVQVFLDVTGLIPAGEAVIEPSFTESKIAPWLRRRSKQV